MPGLVEADDDGTYVLKFRGAGQGTLALVSEVIGGECARLLGLPVPELIFLQTDARLAGAEPDYEIQDLIKKSAGLNLGMDFLPGSLPFAPPIDPQLAANIVWFDSLITNVDRTPRNPNLLTWQRQTYLIDHGASFLAQHREEDLVRAATAPFPMIRQHVLLPYAGPIPDAHERLAPLLDQRSLEEILSLVPEEWPGTHPKEAYVEHLLARLRSAEFVKEAEDVRG